MLNPEQIEQLEKLIRQEQLIRVTCQSIERLIEDHGTVIPDEVIWDLRATVVTLQTVTATTLQTVVEMHGA
jgi:hypothetical protein